MQCDRLASFSRYTTTSASSVRYCSDSVALYHWVGHSPLDSGPTEHVTVITQCTRQEVDGKIGA